MSSLRESLERSSLPIVERLNRLPRFLPFLVILALIVAGIFLPSPGWLLIGVAEIILLWVLALAWPRLRPSERLMRISVIVMLAAIMVVEAFPRS